MTVPADRRAVVAVDLGAQSCRVSLLRWLPEGPKIELVHRIANAPAMRGGHLRWNLTAICEAADEGLRRCAEIAEEGIAAIGVTGWAVDYVRLSGALPSERDEKSEPIQPIGDPFCYRDMRNVAAVEAVHERITASRLYALTGIQMLSINTLYQLYADGQMGIPEYLPWLTLPEYMLYRWGARPVAEYTNATHTSMVALGSMHWSDEIFSAAGLDRAAAPEIVAPGTVVGRFHDSRRGNPLANLPALRDTLLIAPACHDTASAIAGIPASGDDWAYISSGTWSLVGTLLDAPNAGAEAARLNFTNEGGVGGKTCFLRNVNALWLLEQCMVGWQSSGQPVSLENLLSAAAELPAPDVLLDVDDPDLLLPGNMSERILTQLAGKFDSRRRSLSAPEQTVNLILHSIAARYATVLSETASLTKKDFSRLFIVGGGSKNRMLNKLTAEATGLDVVCGAQESSTLGNFAVQLAALEKIVNNDSRMPGVDHDAVASWAAVLGEPSESIQYGVAPRLTSAVHSVHGDGL